MGNAPRMVSSNTKTTPTQNVPASIARVPCTREREKNVMNVEQMTNNLIRERGANIGRAGGFV